MNLFLRSFIIICALTFLWQACVSIFNLPNYILPTPIAVMVTLYRQANIIFIQALPTLLETILGFCLGILLGCIAGFIIAYSRTLKLWLLPLLIISQAIPTFAIAPLIVIWLGYGVLAKIAITVLMIFFPIMSAFYDGLKNTPHAWFDLAQTMNASKWRLFWHIQMPASLPTLASGIRIAAVIAPMGAIIGEWVGSSQGLGYLMLNANARMQIDVMFATLLITILLALLLYFSVDILLRKLIWWQTIEETQ